MNKTIYELKAIEFQDFFPKETKTKLKIYYTKNNEHVNQDFKFLTKMESNVTVFLFSSFTRG